MTNMTLMYEHDAFICTLCIVHCTLYTVKYMLIPGKIYVIIFFVESNARKRAVSHSSAREVDFMESIVILIIFLIYIDYKLTVKRK